MSDTEELELLDLDDADGTADEGLPDAVPFVPFHHACPTWCHRKTRQTREPHP